MCLEKVVNIKDDVVTLTGLLIILKENSGSLEENNSVVFLGDKFMKDLTKHYCCVCEEAEFVKRIKVHLDRDYEYDFTFELDERSFTKLFRLVNVETNDPVYKDVYKEPNPQTDMGALYITKRAEDIKKAIRR